MALTGNRRKDMHRMNVMVIQLTQFNPIDGNFLAVFEVLQTKPDINKTLSLSILSFQSFLI